MRVRIVNERLYVEVDGRNPTERRRKLIELLFNIFGKLKTREVCNYLQEAGIRRSRQTVTSDLNLLEKRGEIERVHKGLYKSKGLMLFSNPIEEEVNKLVRDCAFWSKQNVQEPAIVMYLLSTELRPRGFYYIFQDIAESVLARYIQCVMFSSYLRMAGQYHKPIAPCQLNSEVEIAEDEIDQILMEKGFKGKLVFIVSIDPQKIHRYLKTEEGRRWLREALKRIPHELELIAKGIEYVIELIIEKTRISSEEAIQELGKISIPSKIANDIINMWLPFYLKKGEESDEFVTEQIDLGIYNMWRRWNQLHRSRENTSCTRQSA